MGRGAVFALLLGFAIAAPGAHADALFWRFAQRWEDLTPEQRTKAVANYKRHQKRSDKERKNVEKRYERWKSLPANDKDLLRQRFNNPSKRGN